MYINVTVYGNWDNITIYDPGLGSITPSIIWQYESPTFQDKCALSGGREISKLFDTYNLSSVPSMLESLYTFRCGICFFVCLLIWFYMVCTAISQFIQLCFVCLFVYLKTWYLVELICRRPNEVLHDPQDYNDHTRQQEIITKILKVTPKYSR